MTTRRTIHPVTVQPRNLERAYQTLDTFSQISTPNTANLKGLGNAISTIVYARGAIEPIRAFAGQPNRSHHVFTHADYDAHLMVTAYPQAKYRPARLVGYEFFPDDTGGSYYSDAQPAFSATVPTNRHLEHLQARGRSRPRWNQAVVSSTVPEPRIHFPFSRDYGNPEAATAYFNTLHKLTHSLAKSALQTA